jgi:hypothetical protein
MKGLWPWIVGIAVGLIILALLFGGGSTQEDYRIARETVPRPIHLIQAEGFAAVRLPCSLRAESIEEAQACAFYVWKR